MIETTIPTFAIDGSTLMTDASFCLRHCGGGRGNPSIVCEEERSATERAVSFDAATNGGVRQRKRDRRCERVGFLPHYRVPQKDFPKLLT